MTVERRGAAITIAGLRKEYQSARGHVLALDGIDLSIAPGEFVCIVGPSRLRKVHAAAHPRRPRPADRPARINVERPAGRSQNAMVFQESGLFPWMTVEANVAFGLMTRGVPARPRPASVSTPRSSSSA